jgi:outer membrane protein assembly factor BamB
VRIVDLDVVPPAPARRLRPVAPPRSVTLFLVGLLTLAGVTGSVRPAADSAGPRWSAAFDRNDDTVTLTPTSLYLFHHDATSPALKAYDLATGALRWSAPAPDIVAEAPAVSAGVIVVPDDFERYFNRPDLLLARTTRTIARDARTGAALWRAAGAAAEVTDRSVLLAGAGQVLDVGLRDGRTLWAQPAPGLASVVVLGDNVITATADGRLTVLRYADGAVIRTRQVPWAENSRLSAAAGHLVVTGRVSTVYRPDTLAELWHSDGLLADCRATLCGPAPGGLTGYDPDTGARRWQAPGMTTAWPLRDDRVVATSDLTGTFQLLDPASGARLGPAGTGLGTWRTDPSWAVDAAGTSAFVVHDGTALLRLDVRTGARSLVGPADGAALIGCHTVPAYLVCRHDTRVTVTALDAASRAARR